MATVLEQLEAMRQVEEDWDGYGGAAPLGSAIDLAVDFVRLINEVRVGPLALDLFVSPTRVGGVLIDWDDGRSEHEIEIEPDGSIGFLHMDKATRKIETRTFSPGTGAVIPPGLFQELRHLLAA